MIDTLSRISALQSITVCSSATHWFRDMKEVSTSVLSPGCMDLPIDAGLWLKHFKSQNSTLLSQLDVCVSRDIALLAVSNMCSLCSLNYPKIIRGISAK